jgi:glycogen debranching enzyme
LTATQRYFHELIESLRLLGADYEAQVRILPEFVHIPDEVAITYGEAFLLADQILEAGLIDNATYTKLQNVDKYLEQMDDSKELWTLDALRTRPEWTRVRTLAREMLKSLGITMATPDLEWMTYVKSRNTEDESNHG